MKSNQAPDPSSKGRRISLLRVYGEKRRGLSQKQREEDRLRLMEDIKPGGMELP